MKKRQLLNVSLGLSLSLLTIGKASAVEMACMLEPNTVTNLSTAVEGILDAMHVEKGDSVSKGQVIAALESDVQEANVNLAQARFDMNALIDAGKLRVAYADRKYSRSKALFTKNVITEDKRDDIEIELKLAQLKETENTEKRKVAQMELESAKASHRQRFIESPIDGIVVERYLTVGEFAKGQPILKIASIDPLYVEVISDIQHYGKIKKGMKATVTPESPIGGKYNAVVTRVDKVIDASSGTFGIRLELANKSHKVPAGAACRVKF